MKAESIEDVISFSTRDWIVGKNNVGIRKVVMNIFIKMLTKFREKDRMVRIWKPNRWGLIIFHIE